MPKQVRSHRVQVIADRILVRREKPNVLACADEIGSRYVECPTGGAFWHLAIHRQEVTAIFEKHGVKSRTVRGAIMFALFPRSERSGLGGDARYIGVRRRLDIDEPYQPRTTMKSEREAREVRRIERALARMDA